MSDEVDDDVLPGTPADNSGTDNIGDLTSDLRATLDVGGDDSAVQQAPAVQADPQQQAAFQDNAPSGREGQAAVGGGFMPPPAPSPLSARQILASYGMPVDHYPDDQSAMQDLLVQAYRSQEQAQQAAKQVEALQNYARQLQAQQEQLRAQAEREQQTSQQLKWNPDFADIQAVTAENGETRYVRKSTGLPVAPETVQQAVQYNQSRDEWLRTLYERPQEAMAPIVSEAVQQAMQQFQQYQQQEQRRTAYEQNLSQANDFIVNHLGQSLFQPGPYGVNLEQPTPLGYRYLAILKDMPDQLPPFQKANFAANQLAMEIMASRTDMFATAQQNGQYQFVPNGAQAQMQVQQQLSPGDQQRQALRRVAHRNPSTASPSANGAAESYFEDPNVDIREKLARAMVAG